jgi:FkbM family methyltransferase
MLDRLLRRLRRATAPVTGQPADLSALVALDGTPPLVRLGSAYGGWQIPAAGLSDGAICVCAGAGEDISFDVALLTRYRAQVHVLDPTPRAIAHVEGLIEATRAGRPYPVNNRPGTAYELTAADLERLHLHPIGLWNQDTTLHFHAPADPSHVSHSIVDLQKTGARGGFAAPVQRLRTFLAEQALGRVDLLKIDIEGAEYAVIADMLASGIRPGLVLIEFDEGNHPPGSGGHGRIRDCLQSLRAHGYRLVGIEGWNATLLRA